MKFTIVVLQGAVAEWASLIGLLNKDYTVQGTGMKERGNCCILFGNRSYLRILRCVYSESYVDTYLFISASDRQSITFTMRHSTL